MNRQTILASINRHLRDSREAAAKVRPLSEIVSLVAQDVRRESPNQLSSADVIPIWVVAAFVDGALSDDETESVIEAVQVDNSVIAELIASVLAKEAAVANTPEISVTLASRLMAMTPTRVDSQADPEQNTTDSIPAAISISPAPSTLLDTKVGWNRWQIVLAVATAAAVLLAIYLKPIETKSPSTPDIAVFPPPKMDVDRQPDVIPTPDNIPGPSIDNEEVVKSLEIPSVQPEQRQVPESMPAPKIEPERIVVTPEPMVVPPMIDRVPPVERAKPLTELIWTKLSGIVASQNAAPTVPDYRMGEAWNSVNESTRSFTSVGDRQSLRMITLPLSRAEAAMGSGGRLVLAADTLVELIGEDPAASCVLDVEHGAVALVEVSQGTIVDLRSHGESIGKLRWDTDASVVIGHTLQGLMLQIQTGTLSIDDTAHQDTALVLAAGVEPSVVAPSKRLPNWVDRPIDAIPVSKVILAQLSESANVLDGIATRANALAAMPNKDRADAQTLATLAMWQAALVGPNVARLMNRAEAEIRTAAIQRLVETPTWDPRYESIWAGVDRALDTPRQRVQIQQMCEQLRRGAGAEPAQIELLLVGLSGNSIARRGLSDYLLRGFYRGGPPFDPAWTGQNNVRAVSLWRRAVGR